MNHMGSKVSYATVYHPQSNSVAERANRTLVQMVRAYCGDHGANWEDYIPLIEFAHNTSVSTTTGFTPFRSNHGREAVFPVAFHTTTHVQRPDAQRFLADYNHALTEARARVEEAHLRAALNPPTPRKPHTFKTGDQVLLSTEHLHHRHNKFSNRWVGPFTVKAVLGNAFELDLSTDPSLHRVSPRWNVAYIRRYFPADPQPAQDAPRDAVAEIPVHANPQAIPMDVDPLVGHIDPTSFDLINGHPRPRPAYAEPDAVGAGDAEGPMAAGGADIETQPIVREPELPGYFVDTKRDNAHQLWYAYRAHGSVLDKPIWISANMASTDPFYQPVLKAYQKGRRSQRTQRLHQMCTTHGVPQGFSPDVVTGWFLIS